MHQNSQDAINAAQVRLNLKNEAGREAEQRRRRSAENQRLDAEHRATLAKNRAESEAASYRREISELKRELDQARADIETSNRVIAARVADVEQRDKLIDEWVLSQTAFKNLLKKFGKMPDGENYGDLPKERRIQIALDEEARIVAERKN